MDAQYDDPEFFARYSALDRSVEGLAGAPEWPVLRAMVPDPKDRRVLDLGCGFGWFSRWVTEQGAASVVGVDVSERMLARAAELTESAAVEYRQGDIAELDLGAERFDLVFSALALHYVSDLDGVFAAVADRLDDGGWLVASVEHPIFTAPTTPSFVDGPASTPVWPLDGYLDEGVRNVHWLRSDLTKHHRTVGSYVRSLTRAGLALTDLVEWGPTAKQVADHPDWANERQRPLFLLFSAQRL